MIRMEALLYGQCRQLEDLPPDRGFQCFQIQVIQILASERASISTGSERRGGRRVEFFLTGSVSGWGCRNCQSQICPETATSSGRNGKRSCRISGSVPPKSQGALRQSGKLGIQVVPSEGQRVKIWESGHGFHLTALYTVRTIEGKWL